MRRVERERPRRHLRHAETAIDARETARKQPIAALVGVDHHDIVGQPQRGVDGFNQPPFDASPDDEAIDDDLDGVIAAAIQLDVFVERSVLAVDARLRIPARAERRELLLELAFPAPGNWREHVDALVLRIQHDHVGDALERLAGDFLAAVGTVRNTDVREQQPQVIVDFGDRADRRSRVRSGRLLFDRNRRREALDEIDVRLLHLLEELAGVGRQRFNVPPLPFGVDRVEGERRLPRSRQSRDHDELVPRDVDVDVFQIVDAGAAYGNPVVRHVPTRCLLRSETFHCTRQPQSPQRHKAGKMFVGLVTPTPRTI